MGKRGFGEIERRTARDGRAVTYRARYVGPDVQRHSRTFAARVDAEGWLSNERLLIDRNTWTPPAARKAEALRAERIAATYTVAAFAETYLRDRNLRPATETEYRRLLATKLGPLARRRLDSLNRADLRDWLASLDPSTPAVNAAAYRFLRALLRAAEDEDMIDRAPIVPKAGAAKTVHKPIPATLAELDVLTGAMPERLRLFVALAAWVGLREGELLELRRSDFLRDTDAKLLGTVSVTRTVSKERHPDHPSACADCGRVIGPTKTAAGRRVVTLPAHILPMLREHLLQHTAPGDDGLLFPGERTDHMSARYLRGLFHVARDAAGRPDLRVHDLRHTALTLAGQVGATAAELQHRAGHSSHAAMSIYQHGTLARDAAVAEGLAELHRAYLEGQQ